MCKDCREARAASARAIPPPFRLKPDAKVALEIKREPSETSDPGVDPDAEAELEIKREFSDATDPGVDPDAEVASNVKPEPSDATDPGSLEPREASHEKYSV